MSLAYDKNGFFYIKENGLNAKKVINRILFKFEHNKVNLSYIEENIESFMQWRVDGAFTAINTINFDKFTKEKIINFANKLKVKFHQAFLWIIIMEVNVIMDETVTTHFFK